jgi:hypothetical protein
VREPRGHVDLCHTLKVAMRFCVDGFEHLGDVRPLGRPARHVLLFECLGGGRSWPKNFFYATVEAVEVLLAIDRFPGQQAFVAGAESAVRKPPSLLPVKSMTKATKT